MSDDKRREFIKKGIAATATIGALGTAGNVAAASEKTAYVDASSSPDGPYYFELIFDNTGSIDVDTQDGDIVWGDFIRDYSDDNVHYQCLVESGTSLVINYEGDGVTVEEFRTDGEINVTT
ncbi:hypothetical protein C479_02686 [Halovivax asiaticus JCM 14624]|uniref:Uncharacterized protein n=1 Tax=Halovivax asiaticus JCM 14624 TaxID=1227490 RepID=M0BRT7_9EURY|nr:hypothetical protein [Halovivax asiaticus]ELZ13716.1 hypothetical protein C479_02686 [Halovivax asiaticus JCM 14624]